MLYIYEPYRKILFEYLDMNIIDVVSNIEKSSDRLVFYLSRYKVWRQIRKNTVKKGEDTSLFL